MCLVGLFAIYSLIKIQSGSKVGQPDLTNRPRAAVKRASSQVVYYSNGYFFFDRCLRFVTAIASGRCVCPLPTLYSASSAFVRAIRNAQNTTNETRPGLQADQTSYHDISDQDHLKDERMFWLTMSNLMNL